MMMEVVAWVCTGLGIVGALLNARLSIWGFYLWVPGNLGWIVYFSLNEQWAGVALFMVYTVLAFDGIIHWKKREKQDGCSC